MPQLFQIRYRISIDRIVNVAADSPEGAVAEWQSWGVSRDGPVEVLGVDLIDDSQASEQS